MMKIILIYYLIFIIKSDLVIIGPSDLSFRFSNKPIEIVFRKIQDISNFYVHGEIIFENSTVIHAACTELGPLSQKNKDNEYTENFKILLAYNGDCSVIQKARNAQNVGASMLLLVNNNNEDIKNVILDNDESGSDIKIPVGLISLSNGKIIQNFIENNPNSKIMAEINFQQQREARKKIEFKLFFSSSELKAYELINNMTKYFNQFSNQLQFIPIYVTHQSPSYDPQKPVRELNCVSKGKYCYFPKETTIVQDGQRILIESLRQKCMLLKSGENIRYYYEYMNKFHDICLQPQMLKFNERCSKQTLDNLGYPVDYLDECVADSFGVNSLLSSSYIDNENKIFMNDYDEILKYKLTLFPAAVIDDKPLTGILKENKIIFALCEAVTVKPDFCSFMPGNFDQDVDSLSRKKGWVYFLIFVVVCVNIFLFLKCRKYILLKINEKIEFNKIDVEGRINNFVQNYISLKGNQGNDYQSFDNDTSDNKNKQSSNNQIEGAVNTV